MVLQPAQPLVGAGDGIKGLDHLRLEFRLDCGNREPILHISVVVEVALADRPVGCGLLALGVFAGRLERGGGRGPLASAAAAHR